MFDPLDELTSFFDQLESKRFWGNLLGAAALVLALVCVSSGPCAPAVRDVPLIGQAAAMLALAGFKLDDPLPAR
jgi:hypothetical protein